MRLENLFGTSEIHRFIRNPFAGDLLVREQDAEIHKRAASSTKVKCLIVGHPGQKYICGKEPQNVVKNGYLIMRLVGIWPGSLFDHGREVARLMEERNAAELSVVNAPQPVAV